MEFYPSILGVIKEPPCALKLMHNYGGWVVIRNWHLINLIRNFKPKRCGSCKKLFDHTLQDWNGGGNLILVLEQIGRIILEKFSPFNLSHHFSHFPLKRLSSILVFFLTSKRPKKISTVLFSGVSCERKLNFSLFSCSLHHHNLWDISRGIFYIIPVPYVTSK